jgi:hypothetical protein
VDANSRKVLRLPWQVTVTIWGPPPDAGKFKELGEALQVPCARTGVVEARRMKIVATNALKVMWRRVAIELLRASDRLLLRKRLLGGPPPAPAY